MEQKEPNAQFLSFPHMFATDLGDKMQAFHVQRTMMKKGHFCNFEKEDNGKSLSTFVMQLSAPPPCSAQKNEMRKFHFPHHSHHSYTYLIFVIFFTQATFFENKIYTEKRQFFALNL